MKRSAILLLTLFTITCSAFSQENNDEHLLDGTSMDYYYQNGSAVHAEFINGQFHYKWIAGPNKDVVSIRKTEALLIISVNQEVLAMCVFTRPRYLIASQWGIYEVSDLKRI